MKKLIVVGAAALLFIATFLSSLRHVVAVVAVVAMAVVAVATEAVVAATVVASVAEGCMVEAGSAGEELEAVEALAAAECEVRPLAGFVVARWKFSRRWLGSVDQRLRAGFVAVVQ